MSAGGVGGLAAHLGHVVGAGADIPGGDIGAAQPFDGAIRRLSSIRGVIPLTTGRSTWPPASTEVSIP